jgi:hypothetical protein
MGSILLKEKINKMLNQLGFIKYDESLTDFTKIGFTYANPNYPPEFNIKVDDIIIEGVITNQIIQLICKKIVDILSTSIKFDVIDYLYKDINNWNIKGLDKIILKLIRNENYIYLISSSKISAIIQDLYQFNGSINSSSSIIKIGSILDKSVYVDPALGYSDTRIFLFNDIGINIQNITITENPSSFNGSYVELYIDIKINDSKTIYILESENSNTYKSYKKILREYNLNKLLT